MYKKNRYSDNYNVKNRDSDNYKNRGAGNYKNRGAGNYNIGIQSMKKWDLVNEKMGFSQ
jgi:hypothetical protein